MGTVVDGVPTKRVVITVDARAITQPDAAVLDALVRAQLHAHRIGMRIELRNAPPRLVDLLTLAGLAGELGVEVDGQVEEGEVGGVDEEVDPGDPAV